jgi:hypothetical protein
MPRYFNVEDLSVRESDSEEDVKRLEQDPQGLVANGPDGVRRRGSTD